MKVLAFNGSPRKTWNTATLLNKALEGAVSLGAETEMIHLYDLNYKGCISCFACKMRGGKSYGTCALKDDLTPILKKVYEADALLLGSPVYFFRVTGSPSWRNGHTNRSAVLLHSRARAVNPVLL